MNYTGDVLNFGMGVEKARAMGKKVEMVVVQDDVGVGREKGGKVGRRGIAGAVLVAKVAGALAEMGGSLEECTRVAKLANENVVSVAASLSRTHVPGRPAEDAKLEEERLPLGTCEIGMGIHNEPGCEKVEAELPSLVKKMLAQMLDKDDRDRAYVKVEENEKTVLLMNNFGGLSNLELGASTTEVIAQLMKDYQIRPVRIVAGTLNGSLNGLGFGISIMRLPDTGLGLGKSMLDLVDAPAEVVGWPGAIKQSTWEISYTPVDQNIKRDEEETKPSNLTSRHSFVHAARSQLMWNSEYNTDRESAQRRT